MAVLDDKLIFVCKLRIINVQKLIIFTKNKKVENTMNQYIKLKAILANGQGFKEFSHKLHHSNLKN